MDRIPKRDEDLLQHFEFKKKVRNIKVSTIDIEVRNQLREYNHPVCCFGEDEADRRERLRQIIAQSDGIVAQQRRSGQIASTTGTTAAVSSSGESDTVWYHRAGSDLMAVRKFLTKSSLLTKVVRKRRREEGSGTSETRRRAAAQEQQRRARGIDCVGSSTCASRPLTSCQFAPLQPNGDTLLATAARDGSVRVWLTSPQGGLVRHTDWLSAHATRVSSVVWNPLYGTGSASAIDLASSDHDGVVKFWSMARNDDGEEAPSNTEPVGVLQGLEGHRVGKLGFHPSGRLLATPSYDRTWRLWDLEVGAELMLQEGHTGAVTQASWHEDGAVLLTTDAAGYGRLWDVRSGRCVMFMEGHAGAVLCGAWSPGKSVCATGGEDNCVRLWDVRSSQCAYTVAAHASSVTAVQFQAPQPKTGGGPAHFMVTASLDKTVKLWAHPVWTPLRELAEHATMVMAADLSPDGRCLASAAYDRQVKIWHFPQPSQLSLCD